MQNILVATDLSERSDRAVNRAFHLARELDARLLVVSIIDDNLPKDVMEHYEKAAERALDRIIAANQQAGTVDLEGRILRGDPSVSIATLAQTENAGLLVLGIHRDRLIADTLRDTTMQRVLHQTTCPVLIVRNPSSGPYRSVIGAVDFSPASAAALRAAVRVAPKAKLRAVHALQVPFKGLMPGDVHAPFLREARVAESGWRKTETLPEAAEHVDIVEGSASDVLDAAIREHGADLVAVGAHARTGIVARVLGSLTRSLIREATIDVIVARPA